MKKPIALLLLLTVMLSGCSASGTTSEKEKVKINLPKDNTVNGYRLETKDNRSYGDRIVDADKVAVESGYEASSGNDSQSTMYCANINSKVFHKSDCSSAKKAKEENKLYSKNRTQLIEDGYTPCKQCNP